MLLVLLILHSFEGAAGAQPYRTPFPEEPERYDREYHLDLLTMRIDRDWRDLWDGGDNAFLLRFGSMNVEQWNLQESLKFSAALAPRFRMRFWGERFHTLDELAHERSELEAELRLRSFYYISLLVAPAFWKRENDVGLGIQRRRAVDRYVRLIFRIRDFANNFAYRHGENIEGEENIYTRQPLEAAVEALEELGRRMRLGLSGYATNAWEKEHRFLEGQAEDYRLSCSSWDISLWLECDLSSRLRLDLDARGAAFHEEREGGRSREDKHRVRLFLTRLWWYPSGHTPGRRAAERGGHGDTMITGRTAVCAGLQARCERWSALGDEAGVFSKDELFPFLYVRRCFGRRHSVEVGYLADRYESERSGFEPGSDSRWENRIKISYEINFKGASRFRVIETIDLDREDWGQFSVHDHFFLMSFISF